MTNSKRLFCYDPEKDVIVRESSFAVFGNPVGGQGPRILLKDGKKVYLLLQTGVAEVDPATCQITRVMQVKDGISVGGGIHNGTLYYTTGTRLRGVNLQ